MNGEVETTAHEQSFLQLMEVSCMLISSIDHFYFLEYRLVIFSNGYRAISNEFILLQ